VSDSIGVEVVYALPERQWSATLELPAGASIADALAAVATMSGFRALDLASVSVGIWGRVVTDRSRPLTDGDRLEIYRPLLVEPMLARRQREVAVKGRQSS
jgi:hypothetical protein